MHCSPDVRRPGPPGRRRQTPRRVDRLRVRNHPTPSGAADGPGRAHQFPPTDFDFCWLDTAARGAGHCGPVHMGASHRPS